MRSDDYLARFELSRPFLQLVRRAPLFVNYFFRQSRYCVVRVPVQKRFPVMVPSIAGEYSRKPGRFSIVR